MHFKIIHKNVNFYSEIYVNTKKYIRNTKKRCMHNKGNHTKKITINRECLLEAFRMDEAWEEWRTLVSPVDGKIYLNEAIQ